ncbi:MAG: metallophosphoesterase [Clostridia bacterium]|nr:metallophosphoesterase [Clostridia bacterium]
MSKTTIKNFNKKKIIIICALVLAIVLLVFALDFRMLIRKYNIEAETISSPIRIALVTDLHSCYYGKEQRNLVDAIAEQDPDILLLGGDIFDDDIKDTNTEIFLREIEGKYPTYYVTGNHEYWSGTSNFPVKMDILEKYGVIVLNNEFETLEIRGEYINICGVDDPDAYMFEASVEKNSKDYIDGKSKMNFNFRSNLSQVSKAQDSGYFTVLLSHRPEYFEDYESCGFPLVLCGHAHGGQWRIPYILNGLYAPDQGLFPKYAGGRYDKNNTTMIVSRGLARETTVPIPRIFNRPELVIVDIT